MDYEFMCDCNKIDTLENNISNLLPSLNTYIEDIYSTIDEFESEGIWSGESYNAFKSDCTKYKENLELSKTVIENYCKLLEEYYTSCNNLVNKIRDIETNGADSIEEIITPVDLGYQPSFDTNTTSIGEAKFLTTTNRISSDGTNTQEMQTYYDWDNNGEPDINSPQTQYSSIQNIPSDNQQGVVDDIYDNTHLDVLISGQGNVEQSAEGGINVELEDVDIVQTGVTSNTSDNTTTTAKASIVSDSSSNAAVSMSIESTYNNGNGEENNTTTNTSLEAGFTNNGNAGCLVYSKYDGTSTYECNMTYDEETHTVTETVVDNGVERTNSYTYQAETYEIEAYGHKYTITINPNTESGQLYLRTLLETIYSSNPSGTAYSSELYDAWINSSDNSVTSNGVTITFVRGESYNQETHEFDTY